VGSWSDPLGDGNGFYFVFEIVVNPRGTFTDKLEGPKGSVFYQQAVQINALLIRCAPTVSVEAGQTYIGAGDRSGVMPPLLFAQRYVLGPVQMTQGAARPPAVNAFHPSRVSAMDVGGDVACEIFSMLKGAKISVVLELPEPIQPIADIAMEGSGESDGGAETAPPTDTGGDVTMTATVTMSGGASSSTSHDAPVRMIPKLAAWGAPIMTYAPPAAIVVPGTPAPPPPQHTPTPREQQPKTPQPTIPSPAWWPATTSVASAKTDMPTRPTPGSPADFVCPSAPLRQQRLHRSYRGLDPDPR
jgi:hypothetical protein